MNEFENATPEQEAPVTPQQPQAEPAPQVWPSQDQSAYRNAGAGRRESPFADSPYVRSYDPTQARQYYTQQSQAWQQPTPQSAPRSANTRGKEGRKGRAALTVLLAVLLAVGSSALTAAALGTRWQSQTRQQSAEYAQQLDQMRQQIADLQQSIAAGAGSVPGSAVSSAGQLTPSQVYARNVDAVVTVHSTVVYSGYGQTGTGSSTGSGFIISKDGYVLTNYHVVDGANSVSVTTHAGDSLDATVVGFDDTSDVALLKLSAQADLPFVAIGSSSVLNVGDQVVAIGNPLGELTATMTVGYVSGKERSVTTDGTTINMLQTDAAINSGNSGGPLFNMQGQVIGITTTKFSGSSSSGASIEGIGFAIPIDDIMSIVDELKEFGYIRSAYMGVMVRSMSGDEQMLAELYGMPIGVKVDSAEAGSPAEAAGIQGGDIILSLGQTRVTSVNDLTLALRKLEPGDTTTVTVYRGGEELVLSITLTENVPQTTPAESTPQEPQIGEQMPSNGSYDEWYDYFAPFFGSRP